MNSAYPQVTEAARRILDHAAGRSSAAGATRDAAVLVVSEMRPRLSNLMGSAGFRALLLRAVALTEIRQSWVRSIRVNADGSLGGLDDLEATVDPADFRDGTITLLAQLLSLLALFVGEALTIRLMRDIWPELSLTDLDPGNGDHR